MTSSQLKKQQQQLGSHLFGSRLFGLSRGRSTTSSAFTMDGDADETFGSSLLAQVASK